MNKQVHVFLSALCLAPFILWGGNVKATAASTTMSNGDTDETVYIRLSDEPEPNSLMWNEFAMALNNVDTLFSANDTTGMYDELDKTYAKMRRSLKNSSNIVVFLTRDIYIYRSDYEVCLPANVTLDGCYHSITIDAQRFFSEEDEEQTPERFGSVADGDNEYIGCLTAVNEGVIRRLHLITPDDVFYVKGGWDKKESAVTLYAGAVAGYNKGVIENCMVSMPETGHLFDYITGEEYPRFEIRFMGADLFVPIPDEPGNAYMACGVGKTYMGGIVGRNAGTLKNIDCYSDLYISTATQMWPDESFYGSAVGLSEASASYEYVLAVDKNTAKRLVPQNGKVFMGEGEGSFLSINACCMTKGEENEDIEEISNGLVTVVNEGMGWGDMTSYFNRYADENPNSKYEAYWSVDGNMLAGFSKGWQRDWMEDSEYSEYSKYDLLDFEWGVSFDDLSKPTFILPSLKSHGSRNFLLDVMDVNAFFPGDNWASDLMANPVINLEDVFYVSDNRTACFIPTLRSGWTLNGKGGRFELNAPMVGLVEEGAVVKNLVLNTYDVNAYLGHNPQRIAGPAYYEGPVAFGLVTPVNKGAIENCEVNGIINTGVSSVDTSFVSGKGYQIGGLVGRNEGSVTSCVSYVFMNAEEGFILYDGTPVSIDLGGLVGRNIGSVKDCYVHTKRLYGDIQEVSLGTVIPIVRINENNSVANSNYDFSSFVNEEQIAKRNVGTVIGNNTGGTVSKVFATTINDVPNDFLGQITSVVFASDIIEETVVLRHSDTFNSSNVHYDGEPWPLYVPTYTVGVHDVSDRIDYDQVAEEASKQKGYFNTPLSILNFENPARWTSPKGNDLFNDDFLWVYQSEEVSSQSYFTFGSNDYILDFVPGLNFTSTVVNINNEGENLSVNIEISDMKDARTLAEQIEQANELFGSANINMTDNIGFETVEDYLDFYLPWDRETTVEDVPVIPSFGSDDAPFSGSFNGNGNTLGGAQGTFANGTLFKTDKESGTPISILNLTVQGRIYVDIKPYVQVAVDNDCDTIYVPIIVDKLNGTASCVNFDGSIFYDDSLVGERIVVLCLIVEGEGFDRGFMYLFNDQDYNKSMVRLDNNTGVGKGKGTKTATSLVSTNKALGNESDRMGNSEAFSKEEFALGVASFWLNCAGQGYVGPYQPLYSVDRATGRPIMASETNKAIERLVYRFTGLEINEAGEDMVQGGVFYKEGEDVDLVFNGRMPSKVTAGGELVVVEDGKASFKMPLCDNNGDVILKVMYGTTDLEQPAADNNDIAIVKNAVGVTVFNAAGETLSVYSLDGTLIKTVALTSNNQTIMLSKGLSVVSVGAESAKILVK